MNYLTLHHSWLFMTFNWSLKVFLLTYDQSVKSLPTYHFLLFVCGLIKALSTNCLTLKTFFY
jgi:hypothetical protein